MFLFFSDGLGRSGTFCALYSVLERLKIEQVVDVFQTIKAMRIPRPGLVKSAVSGTKNNRVSEYNLIKCSMHFARCLKFIFFSQWMKS